MKSPEKGLMTFWRQNSGYTTIELLIAMQLTLLIIGLVYSSYLFSRNLLSRWQEKIQIETQMAVLSRTLSLYLWNIDQILDAQETEILALTRSGDSLRLRLNKSVYINQDSLIILPLKIREGKFIFITRSCLTEKIREPGISSPLADVSEIAGIRVEVALDYKNRQYHCRMFCRLQPIQPGFHHRSRDQNQFE